MLLRRALAAARAPALLAAAPSRRAPRPARVPARAMATDPAPPAPDFSGPGAADLRALCVGPCSR